MNFHKGKQIELYGWAISAKRYCLYRYDSDGNIVIVSAKAHGLGYLYPPMDSSGGWHEDVPEYVFDAWQWILEDEVAVPRPVPKWFNLPAMMRMNVSTPAVLGMLRGFATPFGFIHVPLPIRSEEWDDKSVLVMPFSTKREEWNTTKAIDSRTGKKYSLLPGVDPEGRRTRKLEVKTYGLIMGAYKYHPEAKFLDLEGNPCKSTTQGLLRRSHIIGKAHCYIGKETSRHWEQGDDMSLLDFRCAEYSGSKVTADAATIERIKCFGIRKLEREAKIDHKTIILIIKGGFVKSCTLRDLIRVLDDHKKRRKSPGFPNNSLPTDQVFMPRLMDWRKAQNER